MFSKSGLLRFSWVVFVVFMGAWAVDAQAGVLTHPQVSQSKPVVRTIAVRDMRNANLPAIMRRVMGTQHYTPEQQAQLRDKLVRAGYLKAAQNYFTIPLLQKRLGTAPHVVDKDLQSRFPAMQPKDFTVPIASFDGLGASTSGGDGCAPPDTNAAAGDANTNQVVEIVNCAGGAGQGTFAVYSKTGTLLVGPVALGSLWTSGVCESGFGDNVVDYDQLANRWIISQFAGSGVPTDECVAVSTSDDATGTYNVYDFSVAPGNFADYPKISVWPDAYYLTTNEFNGSGSAFLGVNFVALDRAEMIAGTATAQMVEFAPSPQTALAYSVLPADLDGLNAPPAGAPGIFVNYVSPALFTGAPYALEIWQLHVDWTTPSNSTLGGPTELDVNAFNDGICGFSRACIPEPSPGENVDSLGDRLMFRLAYRVTPDGVQHLVANHTVGSGNPSNPPSGVRWYELQAPSGSVDPTTWTVAQQGTYLPADGSSRWMGSVAMDQSGDMALGYSLSSSSINPSIAYTGRLAGDPASVMTQPETTVLTGGGVQESTANRWGDYSSMVMDPSDDCTFWYAQEYYQTSGSFAWSTHLASFKFPSCTSGPSGTLTGQVTDAGTGNPIKGATITLVPNNITTTTDSNGNYSLTVPVNTYTATASDFGYIAQSDSETISDGVTTTQNFALTAAPTGTVSGNVLDGTPSGHTYGLYGEIKVSASGVGQVADIWANPQTGAYSLNLPADGVTIYTFNVTSYLPGYTPGSFTINGLTGNTTQNLPLVVGASCAAPGYTFINGFGQDFDEGFPPTGWTITNNGGVGSTVVWNTNTFWTDLNYTGGSGIAATAESNKSGYFGVYDTALVTPEIQVSSLPASPTLEFALNYQEFSGNEALDVDVSGDGGTTWTNEAHINTNQGALYNTPGLNYQVPLTIPGGATQIEIRWRYYNLAGGNDWYAQVDNVAIGACGAISGGLVQGAVTDQNTSSALLGATLADSNAPPNTTKTFTNAADPNLPAAYYILFSNTNAADVITASDAGYTSGTATLNVTPDSVTLQNFGLAAPQFVGSPGSFNIHVMVNTQSPQTFTINNTGTGAGNYSFLTFDFPPPSGPAKGIGAPLNVIQCTHLSPMSLVWSHGKGGVDPGCGDSFARRAPDDAPWTNIAGYPTPIMDNTAAEDESTGKVYSVGGYDGTGNVATGNVYDPSSGTWSPIANMPSALEKPTGVFLSGKLYVANGWNSSGNPSPQLAIYDPSSNTWSTGAVNPAPQGGGSVAVALNNKMYVIGGCNASTCGATTVEVYDPSADSWSGAVAQYPIPDSWESCGAVSGKIYCAGGSAAAETPNTYVYDPSADTWTQLASIPVASGGLWGSGYIATGQGLFISGGVTANFTTVTNKGYMYTPGTNTWTSLPNSNNTVYRGGSACGFYKIGGSTGGFSPVPNSELLPGLSPCGTSPIPWLTINPATGTVPAGGSTPVTFTFDGTGQTEFTTSQAYVLLAGTPYAPQQVDLTVTWDPQPIDLMVSATGSLGTILQGSIVVYTVTITNQSGANQGAASQTTLNYTLPAGVTDIVNNGPGACSVTASLLSCNFGTLAMGASVTETIVISPANTGTLTSTFTASAREPEVGGANPQASVSTTVLGLADISVVSYQASPASVTVGSTATFKLVAANAGPDTATGVMVTAPLPASLSFQSASAGCSNNGGVVTCNLGNINSGANAGASITVRANTAGAVSALAVLSSQSVDPKVSNNSGMATLRVVPAPVAPPPSSGSGSSGGGGEDLLALMGLAGLLGALRLRKGRRAQQ